jgi:NADH-quinone oxidoreductase subunit C
MSHTIDIDALDEHGDSIASALEDAVLRYEVVGEELTLYVPYDRIVQVMRHLRDEGMCQYKSLIDLTAVDYPGRERRFDLVYHMLSMRQNQRIRVKTALREGEIALSIMDVFSCAEWYERETFDMYGILFSGHPDMRRILTDYGFRGYPLRKDFPVTGYVELRYDEEVKRVVYEPVKLVQEMRSFDFMSPWEGAEYILPGDEKADEKEGAA